MQSWIWSSIKAPERRPFRSWLTTLLDHAKNDPDFADAQGRLVTGVLQPLRDVLADAIERGTLEHSISTPPPLASPHRCSPHTS